MKHLIITALLAVSLFATAPAAKAADWNNDKLSCDIKVSDTWFGKWFEFDATIYQTSEPKVFLTFKCRADTVSRIGGNQYSCTFYKHGGEWDWKVTRTAMLVLEFAPGITQKQTCEKMFTNIHPTPK